MDLIFLAAGTTAGAVLIPFLVATAAGAKLRIWPTPGLGTWQSLVFWTSFRTLNLAAIGTALFSQAGSLALPEVVRATGLVVLVSALGLYLTACITLGRENTYCERSGLVTGGIYRWTRNPQYATIIPLYCGLAVAADNGGTYLLCAGLVAVYVLMAVVEEPWLEVAYGAAYARYRQRVPRFFNWHRLLILVQWRLRGPLLKPLVRQHDLVRLLRARR